MSDPWLSIIVPIYNPPKNSFEAALATLIEKQYDDIEILLIDDGSDEWVEKYIKEKTHGKPNINYWKKQNGGVSSARNFGIEHASGKYICFSDADDKLLISNIKALKNHIPENAVFVIFDFVRELVNNGQQIRISLFNEDKIVKIDKDNLDYNIIGKLRESVAKLYLREKIMINNLRFNTSMAQAEDMMFVNQYLENCEEYHYYHTVVYHYFWDMRTTNRRILNNPICRLNDARKAYEKECSILEGNVNSINLCTDSFIEMLGSRTLLLLHNHSFNKEISNKIKELYLISSNKSKVRSGMKPKLYNFLLKHNLWLGFKILSAIRYRKEKRL